jgi:NADH-quinone oxidoreductase subunit J
VGAAIFYIAGAFALGSAISVVVQRNPFMAAFSLILHFAMLAVLYLDLQADFVAAAQVLVYAGGVMILFIFALAYLGERAEVDLKRANWSAVVACVAGAAIFLEVVLAVMNSNAVFGASGKTTEQFGSPAEIGNTLFTTYLLPFEVVSIVLLVGAVAGVVLGAVHLPRLRPEAKTVKPLPEASDTERETVGAEP